MAPGLITAYGTQNQTFSYNVDNHEFMAGYWVKAKPDKWGLFTNPITPSDFERLGTNQGVFVRVTVKGGLAHQAGLMRGDVLLQINSEKVADQVDLDRLKEKNQDAGYLMLNILRSGEQKILTLRPSSENQ